MKLLACQVPENMLADGEYFESNTGVSYLYMVEMDEDTVRITDTIGRSMPFDVSELQDMSELLSRLNRFVVKAKVLDELLVEELLHENTWAEDEISEWAPSL